MSTNDTAGALIISASAAGFSNTNYYIDDTPNLYYNAYEFGMTKELETLLEAGVSSNSIVCTNVRPSCNSLECHITYATGLECV
jgi:hypothetical protein